MFFCACKPPEATVLTSVCARGASSLSRIYFCKLVFFSVDGASSLYCMQQHNNCASKCRGVYAQKKAHCVVRCVLAVCCVTLCAARIIAHVVLFVCNKQHIFLCVVFVQRASPVLAKCSCSVLCSGLAPVHTFNSAVLSFVVFRGFVVFVVVPCNCKNLRAFVC